MLDEQRFRQTAGLFAEHQVVAVAVFHLMIGVRRLCCRIEVAAVRIFLKKFIQIFIHTHIEQMPVVQTGTLHALIVDSKAERLDQMQHTTCRRTGAGNVAGVLRDLRLDQNNVEHTFASFTN